MSFFGYLPSELKHVSNRIATVDRGSRTKPNIVYAPPVGFTSTTSISTASAVTYTAAQLCGGRIDRDPAGASRLDTLPTAASLVSFLDNAVVGMSLDFIVHNTADAQETITLVDSSDITVFTGTPMLIGREDTHHYLLIFTSVTPGSEAAILYLHSANNRVAVGVSVTQAPGVPAGTVVSHNQRGTILTAAQTAIAGAEQTFTVTNNYVLVGSTVVLSLRATNSTGTPVANVTNVVAGAFDITITNLHASAALNDVLNINYAVIQ